MSRVFFLLFFFLLAIVVPIAQCACEDVTFSSSTATSFSGDCFNILGGTLDHAVSFYSSSSLTITFQSNVYVTNIDTSAGSVHVLSFAAYGGTLDIECNGKSIIGSGYLDQNHKPGMISIDAQKGGYFQNLNIYKAPAWNVAIVANHFTISNIYIDAESTEGNTDGFDICCSTDITMKNIYVSNNDDCIAIGEKTSSITINGITCKASSNGGGIALATNGNSGGDITGITVTGAQMYSQVPGALSIRTTSNSKVVTHISGVSLSGTVYSGNHVLLITQQCPNEFICDPQVGYWSQLTSQYCPSSSNPGSASQGSAISGTIDISHVVSGYGSHPSYFSYVEVYVNPAYMTANVLLPDFAKSNYKYCSEPAECWLTSSAEISDQSAVATASSFSGAEIAGIAVGAVVFVLLVFVVVAVEISRRRKNNQEIV